MTSVFVFLSDTVKSDCPIQLLWKMMKYFCSGDTKKKKKKSSENDQSTGHFQSLFFFFLSPDPLS